MLANLSKREKTLALLVGALLPAFLLFWGVSRFSSSYFELRNKKRNLMTQVQDEQDKIDRLQKAQQRRVYYANISAPASASQANIAYQNWLIQLIEGAQLKYNSVTPNKTTNTLSVGTGRQQIPVAEEFTYRVNASGRLDQIVSFLDKFNQIHLLHRIKSIDLKRIVDKSDEAGSKGIRLDLEVQLLRLLDAPPERDFLSALNHLQIDNTEKTKAVLTRNFFGPANNAPAIRNGDESFEVALDAETVDVSFSINANDEDEADELTFELLSSEIPGGTVKQKSPKDRRAEFAATGVPVGEYEVRVKVADSGVPAKFVEKAIRVSVEKEKAKPEKPKPAPFRYAGTTFLTGKKGDDVFVNNKARPDGLMVVKIGETFELDGITWKIVSVEGRIVTIEKGSELVRYRLGGTLDQPIDKEQPSPKSEDSPDDAPEQSHSTKHP